MHIPEYATTNIEGYSNIILGIQGPAGSGKTTAALTFNNVLLAAFERPDLEGIFTLPQFAGKQKPPILPFYDAEFVTKTLQQPMSGEQFDSPNCFLNWLRKAGPKLAKEQTLVLDNWTRLQEHFDRVNWNAPLYPTYGRGGQIDDFAPWNRKIDFAENVSNALLALKCNVVVIVHEIQEREQGTGRLLDKVQPLMQGKFLAKMKSYYPNFFRQVCRQKRGADGKAIEGSEPEYLWQTKSSDMFDAKCSRPAMGALVPATYESFVQPRTT